MNILPTTYLVTQSNHSRDRTTPEIVRAAVAGGVDTVQLREKHANDRDRLRIAREVREVTREAGVTFLVNDRVDLAQAVDADGVHLGDDDLPVPVARELLGPDAVVGRSVSTVAGAREAVEAGADYLGVGAVYPTSTKQMAESIGPERVRAVVDAVDVPVVGIGGVTPENAHEVVEAGADGVAVVSAITAAEDPERAASRLRAAVEGREVTG
jgi:thiamine-phosphate pyrophosphorylase